MENAEFATVLEEIADLLEIQGASVFRIRAYRNAAYAVAEATRSIEELATAEDGVDRLQEISGIGSSIAEKLREIAETGECEAHRELLEEVPGGLLDVLRIQGVGPKKAKLFLDELGVESVEDLEAAAREGRLAALEGMGEKSQAKVLKAIEQRKETAGRTNIAVALPHAESLAAHLLEVEGVEAAEPAGSLRRHRETVGDVDVLCTCPEEQADGVMAAVREYPGVRDVIASGSTKTSILLAGGLQADVRVVPPASYGAALHYFTGSKNHNVAVRDRGKREGLKINEYGVFREEEDGSETRVGGEREEDVFEAVDLPWIPPELRENRGEIEAAEAGELPDLVEVADIRGDLQMHTTRSDGKVSAREMARTARELGHEYIAITDHSQAVTVAGGQTGEELLEQVEEIRALAEDPDLEGIAVLAGVECDILADGSLDLEDEALEACDWVVGAVHYSMEMPRDEMTDRIVRGLETGLVHALAHPTGRRIGHRPPYAIDLDRIIEAALAHDVALEINAHPERLDLNDTMARQAREAGVPLVISTDAHQPSGLEHVRWGVSVARRAWAEAGDILNARPLDEFLAWIE